MARAKPVHAPLAQALDEARFGPARTLDLRTSLPTVAEALRRAEPWMRERQMARAGEVLIITGRGAGSPDGIGAVRAAITSLLARLKRAGVVENVRTHTAGSFVVEFASIQSLFDVNRRSRHPEANVPLADPQGIAALDEGTRRELRLLAEYSLRQLGVPAEPTFVQDEMLRQFSVLVQGMAPDEPDREGRLKFLVSAARAAYEDDA
jgi:hypothetical protein